MKVSIVRGGGVAGVTTLTELDEGALSIDDAKAFRAKLADAQADLGTAGEGSASRHPDELQYELTLANGETTRTLRAGETTLPEHVRSLIAWVDTHPERTTRVLPPGGG
jgi:hypothetical protein